MQQMISYRKLPSSFYLDDTVTVARNLIGKLLVRRTGGETLSAIICETEAYTGFSDKACHSYRGKSERTQVMFDKGGKAYVYLIYGMYCCFNVTTGGEGVPEAVLIRAAQPVEGTSAMMELRQRKRQIKSLNERNLLSGPGRLCDGLGIGKEDNGKLLTGEELFLCEGISVPPNGLRQPKESTLIMRRKQKIFFTDLWTRKVPVFRSNGKGKTDERRIVLESL